MRSICIHGHFYQPPREDPWTGEVERQDSAAPYHDWNERVTAECYGPNTAARIVDGDGRIETIVDNFSRISFDVGPTLLAWLEEREPRVYRAILEADRESARRFSGHGSAIAQAYHHSILPLASPRDRRTEVLWGIRDFHARFGRDPEGMWLPETAVDGETLELLAGNGILFTVLAPHQARRVRRIGEAAWTETPDATVDPRKPYFAALPSGRKLALFFYDGPVSRAVAFEKLLNSADEFVARMLRGSGAGDELEHIATDGESYGHHHPHGDMALAAALVRIESNGSAALTNYGEYLERHPPEDEAEVAADTSWSCAHGLGRWERDCGCRSWGGTQGWRSGLRKAFDGLRDEIAPRFESACGALLADPWKARDDAIELFNGGTRAQDAFFAWHAARPLARWERGKALKLLDLQRNALRMYTSCGWFFDDVSGLEGRQVIEYAGRAVELAEELFGPGIEEKFLALLAQAKSNYSEFGDGRAVYERFVRGPMLHPPHVVEPEQPTRAMERAVTRIAEGFESDPSDERLLRAWRRVVQVAVELPFPVRLWTAQNVYFRIRRTTGPEVRKRAAAGDAAARSWLEHFVELGNLLGFTPLR